MAQVVKAKKKLKAKTEKPVMEDRLRVVNTVNTIVAVAESDILKRCGLRLRLLIIGELPEEKKTPMEMANVIANCLGLTYDAYSNHSRQKKYVHLRHLCASFLRQYFPELTLKDIGRITGHADHTTVISSIKFVKDNAASTDFNFDTKYNQVLQTVTQWIRE